MKKNLKHLMVGLLASTMALGTVQSIHAQATYTVKSGEWLLKIANDHGVSLADLQAWNGLTSDWLDEGQVLYIENPGSASESSSATPVISGSTYVVQPGDTLYTIAIATGTTVDALMANNGLSSSWLNVGDVLYLTAGGGQASQPAPITSTPSASGYHVVQPGDTLSYIAIANGTTVENIMAINGLTSTWLNVGDKLALTGSGASSVDSGITYTDDWSGYHTVQAGETLWDIANAYGTTYEALMAANGLSSSYLNVGDQIAVPGYIETVVANDSAAESSQPSTSPASSTSNSNKKDKEKESDKEKDTEQDLRELSKEELEKLYKELPETARPRKHKVAEGESLESIAQTYNFSVNSIKEWNELSDDQVPVGEEIYVSNPRYIPEVYEVAAGDSLDSIASQFEISTQDIDEWNKLNGAAAKEGDKLVVSDPTPRQHKVQPKESLEAIAKKYGISKEQLIQWNNLPETVQFFNGTLAVVDPEGVEFDQEAANTDEQSSADNGQTEASQESSEEETTVSET